MAEKIALELTKKEFENLLVHLYIGNWILTDTTEDDALVEKLDKFSNKFLKQAKAGGFESLVSYDKQLKELFLNDDIEERCLDILDEYEDLNFWEALAARLAERDLDLQDGELDKATITDKQVEERYMHYLKLADQYSKEFEKRGIDDLILKNGFTAKKPAKAAKPAKPATTTKAAPTAKAAKPAKPATTAKAATAKKA